MSSSSAAMPVTAPSPEARPPVLAARNGHPHPLITPLIHRVFGDDHEYRHYANSPVAADPAALQDFIFAADDDGGGAIDPDTIFHRLRWGGQFVFASRHARRVAEVSKQFNRDGFRIEREPAFIRKAWPFLSFLAPRTHYFAARKIHLIRPGEFTERFTYHIELIPHQVAHDEEFVVLKRVPSVESLVAKLHKKFPDTPIEAIEKRARKFTEKIFPTFLTREAAILKILQEHLPSRYAHRVPRVIDLEKDIRGFVTCLKMNWLRNGGRRLSQLEFAIQAADLLQAVHDFAGVLHLDLRLDNMVITDHGVGFIDFGSSMRVTENLATNPMLDALFSELMRTSHIQRMLYHMTTSGQVTAQHLCSQLGKADKGIDVFYLSLQFTTPHANPDLAGLIHYDPQSEMARQISELSKTVLRPGDPADTSHKSAKDILRSLELLERDINRRARR